MDGCGRCWMDGCGERVNGVGWMRTMLRPTMAYPLAGLSTLPTGRFGKKTRLLFSAYAANSG